MSKFLLKKILLTAIAMAGVITGFGVAVWQASDEAGPRHPITQSAESYSRWSRWFGAFSNAFLSRLAYIPIGGVLGIAPGIIWAYRNRGKLEKRT